MFRSGWIAVALVSVATTALSQKSIPFVEESPLPPIERRIGLTEESERLSAAWSTKKWQPVVELADEWISRDKTKHCGYSLKYLALLELKRDRALALQFANRATRSLAPQPLQLVGFIECALFADPKTNEFQLALMALVPILPAARRSPRVRIAHLRALDGCSTAKEAAAMSRTIVEDLGKDSEAQFALAQAICEMRNAKPMGQTALKALEWAIGSRRPNYAEMLLKYRILHDLLGRRDEARKQGARIILWMEPQNLNSFLWNLMVEPHTGGKYPTLALQAARVLEMSSSLGRHEWDTIALAYFRNGQPAKAIQCQQRAVRMAKEAGDSNPEYEAHLRAYLATGKAPAEPAASGATKAGDEGKLVGGVKVGLWTHKWDDGHLRAKGEYENGKRVGLWKFWNRTGWLERQAQYVADKAEGKGVVWSWDPVAEKPYKAREDTLVDGRCHGECLKFHANGNLRSREVYDRGSRHGACEYFNEDGRRTSKGEHRYGRPHGRWEHYALHPKTKKPYLWQECIFDRGDKEGEWRSFYPDGTVSRAGQYSDDVMVGVWTEYHTDGKLRKKGEMKGGKWEGLVTYYAPAGWVQKEGVMRAGKYHGRYATWQWNEKIKKRVKKSEGECIEGFGVGEWKYYHPNGVVSLRGTHELGQRDGIWKGFHPNGKRTRVMAYENGTPTGEWREWHPNGNLIKVDNFKKGKRHGPAMTYFDNGKPKSETNYKRGVDHGIVKLWHKSGHLKIESTYVDGLQVGECKKWRSNGKLFAKGAFAKGRPEGTWTKFHDNGKILLVETYRDGMRVGVSRRFHPNGERQAEGSYQHGIRTGPWTYWHANKQIEAKGSWKNGVRHGAWIFYHDNGTTKARGLFDGGARTGRWTYWDRDGEEDPLKSGVYREDKLEKTRKGNGWDEKVTLRGIPSGLQHSCRVLRLKRRLTVTHATTSPCHDQRWGAGDQFHGQT